MRLIAAKNSCGPDLAGAGRNDWISNAISSPLTLQSVNRSLALGGDEP